MAASSARRNLSEDKNRVQPPSCFQALLCYTLHWRSSYSAHIWQFFKRVQQPQIFRAGRQKQCYNSMSSVMPCTMLFTSKKTKTRNIAKNMDKKEGMKNRRMPVILSTLTSAQQFHIFLKDYFRKSLCMHF